LPVSDFEEAARLVVKISKIVEIAKEAKIALWFGDRVDTKISKKDIRQRKQSAEVIGI